LKGRKEKLLIPQKETTSPSGEAKKRALSKVKSEDENAVHWKNKSEQSEQEAPTPAKKRRAGNVKSEDDNPAMAKAKKGGREKVKGESDHNKSEEPKPKKAPKGKIEDGAFKHAAEREREMKLQGRWIPRKAKETVLSNFPLVHREPTMPKARKTPEEIEQLFEETKIKGPVRMRARKKIRKEIEYHIAGTEVEYTEAETKHNLKRDDAVMDARELRDAQIYEKVQQAKHEHDVKIRSEYIDGRRVYGPLPRYTRWTPAKIAEGEARQARLPYLSGREREWIGHVRRFGVFSAGSVTVERS